MTLGAEHITVQSTKSPPDRAVGHAKLLRQIISKMKADPQFGQLAGTFFTTLAIFGVFLAQGIIVARILGPAGRGEFGTALFFPRDILLYAGLLGSIEIVTGYAARGGGDLLKLRFAAIRLGLVTGLLTAAAAALLSIALLTLTGKQYLIPFSLVCCLFVPWEHMHLTVSSVDRGSGRISRYNVSRFVIAIAFPLLVGLAWFLQLDQLTGLPWLWLMCGILIVAKGIGLWPTVAGMGLFSVQQWRQVIIPRARSSDDTVPATRDMLRQGRPYALSTLVTELFERLDILLIVALADVTNSGYYFVAVPAAALLIIGPNALGVFTFNAGARSDVRVTRRLALKVLGATALFQVVGTVILALIIGQLIQLFYGPAFLNAVPFALWLLPASAMKGFLQAADGYLKGRQKTMIGVWSRVLSIVVMLLFVSLTYRYWGLISVPMSACVGQSVSMLIMVSAILVDVSPSANRSSGGEAK